MTFLTYLFETLTEMATLSKDCLGKLSRSELVGLVSGLQNKLDSLKSILFNEIEKLNWKLSWLKSDIVGTKTLINCYPSGSSVWVGKSWTLQ